MLGEWVANLKTLPYFISYPQFMVPVTLGCLLPPSTPTPNTHRTLSSVFQECLHVFMLIWQFHHLPSYFWVWVWVGTGNEQPLIFTSDISLFIYFLNFIYFWLHWVFIAACRLSLVVVSGGFSCCRARALGARASVVAAHGLSSCGTQAQ